MEAGGPFVRVGILIGGPNAVRAAHSLDADPAIDEVVVVGPATSRNFDVIDDPTGLDFLVGSGDEAPLRARGFELPLVWDGDHATEGAKVWGASATGLALAMSMREKRTSLAASVHPDNPPGSGRSVRLARPVGAAQVSERQIGDKIVLVGRSYNEFAGCLVKNRRRSVTIIDKADFLSGIALAAGVAAIKHDEAGPVWDAALPYLEMATGMGLVMAEA